MQQISTVKVWGRLFGIMASLPAVQTENGPAICEPMGDEEQDAAYAARLEQRLDRENLIIGVKEQNGRVHLDYFPHDAFPEDYQEISPLAALGYAEYRQQLINYFMLGQPIEDAAEVVH